MRLANSKRKVYRILHVRNVRNLPLGPLPPKSVRPLFQRQIRPRRGGFPRPVPNRRIGGRRGHRPATLMGDNVASLPPFSNQRARCPACGGRFEIRVHFDVAVDAAAGPLRADPRATGPARRGRRREGAPGALSFASTAKGMWRFSLRSRPGPTASLRLPTSSSFRSDEPTPQRVGSS